MNPDVQSIELDIAELQEKIALAEALEKLERSPAFKLIISKGYFEKRAQELARASARASLNETSAKVHANAMVGIGALHDYFQAIYREGNAAHATLAEAQEMRDEVNADE